jgi:hypothetical protein
MPSTAKSKSHKHKPHSSVTARLSRMSFGSTGARTIMPSPKIAIPSGSRSAFQMAPPAPGVRVPTMPHTILEARARAGARAPAEGGLTEQQFNELRFTNPGQHAHISKLLRDEAVTYLPILAAGARGTIPNAEIDRRVAANPKLAPFVAERRVPAIGGKRRYSKTRSKKRRL